MVKVKKITVKSLDFKENYKGEIKKLFSSKDEMLDLLPKKSSFVVSFELHDTPVALANAIRRCLINEIPVLSLDFDEFNDLDVSDPFIPDSYFKRQIRLLRISQKITNWEKYELSLYKKNETDNDCYVYSHDLTCEKAGKKINIGDVVNPNVRLTGLRPGEYVHIKNIKIVQGLGTDDAGAYKLFANVSYKILDVIPLNRETGEGKSSLLSDPRQFRISYETYRNVETPKTYMNVCCDILTKRLQQVEAGLKDPNMGNIEIDEKDIVTIKIHGEGNTICNLIAKYCYISNIKFITSGNLHPQTNIGIIKISHPEWKKIMEKSIKNIVEDLKTISKEF